MDLVLSSAIIRYEFVKKTISDTKNETNIFLVSQKMQRISFLYHKKYNEKQAWRNRKCTEPVVFLKTPLTDTHGRTTFRNRLITTP